MPILDQAKKAMRQSVRRRAVNDSRRRAFRESVKDVRESIKVADPKEMAAKLMKAYQALDKAAKRGVIKKNTASRRKSRLAIAIGKVTKK